MEASITVADEPEGSGARINEGGSSSEASLVVAAVAGGSEEAVAKELPKKSLLAKKKVNLGPVLDHIAVLSHLVIFGILGTGFRYCLNILFDPQIGKVTGDDSTLFIDLPSNMVGSFLMGWVGVVVKQPIANFLEPLSVGLSTGLCGSITTFASWNQRLLATVGKGYWLRAFSGYLIGAQLSMMSLLVGIHTAEAFWTFVRRKEEEGVLKLPREDNLDRRWLNLILSFSVASLLWIGTGIAIAIDGCFQRQKLWTALCMAPLGVWVRWYLSRYNGGGIGKGKKFQWLPVGTLAANLGASVLEAFVSLIGAAVHTRASLVVTGALQIGFLGCMSTVSTFVVEIKNLWDKNSPQRWRAYGYLLLSLSVSFVLGLVIYNVPVWVHPDYQSKYVRIEGCNVVFHR